MADLSWLNEPVDENGFFLSAVEEWKAHGIYPPPLCGRPTPETVELLQRQRAEWAALSPEERVQRLQEAHRRADEVDRRLGIDTRPSTAFKSW